MASPPPGNDGDFGPLFAGEPERDPGAPSPRRGRDGGAPAPAGGGGVAGSQAHRTRCRSFTFLERSGERWTVFLITHPGEDGHWRGHFAFRPATGEAPVGEIRTANLFVEGSEAEVDDRARNLGRPLLSALLDSAIHTYERRRGLSPDVRQWFREVLAENSAELLAGVGTATAEHSLSQLRSLYESYRLDQVAHLIALIRPDDFRALVERVLDGKEIDFRARDRFQLAMLVVRELERHLPLPPFEAWVEDYLAHPVEYQLYSHALNRVGELP